eukprot:3084727-Amphidinium_carterae.1
MVALLGFVILQGCILSQGWQGPMFEALVTTDNAMLMLYLLVVQATLLCFTFMTRQSRSSQTTQKHLLCLILVSMSPLIIGAMPAQQTQVRYSSTHCVKRNASGPARASPHIQGHILFDPPDEGDCLFACLAH